MSKETNIYLYGASDDCMECEVVMPDGTHKAYESYEGFTINGIQVHFVYDGDWGIWLEGQAGIPALWRVKSIRGNCAHDARNKPHGGQFLHIRIPADEVIAVVELP
jgi:hypothetical protein